MSSIGQVNSNASLLFAESVRAQELRIIPEPEAQSRLTANSFNNRGNIPDFLSKFRSKLESFQTRLATNSFLSNSYSWPIKTARVSDSNKILALASSSADEKDYSINIERLATSRTAKSDRLVSNEVTDFDSGTYSFDLTVDSTSYSLDVEIDKSALNPDTNKDVLRKIGDAIEESDSNLTAFVIEENRKDYNPYAQDVYERVSYLTVRNKSTGDEVDFSLADTSGDLIEELGLDRISSFGKQNQYSINGTSINANSNIISLDSNRLSAYLLNKTDSGSLKISVKGGTQPLERELIDIVANYNSLIDWLDDNRRFITTDAKKDLVKNIESTTVQQRIFFKNDAGAIMQGELSSALRTEPGSLIDKKLNEIGLMLSSQGRLEMNDDFSSAIKRDLRGVHETLAGEQGFFTKIGSAINDILIQSGKRYIPERSNFITYDSSGSSSRNIYRQGASQLISIFA